MGRKANKEQIASKAAAMNWLDGLRIALEMGVNYTWAMEAAAENGHIQAMEMIWNARRERKVELGGALSQAARHGHINAINWLIERSADEWVEHNLSEALSSAADGGQLTAMRTLRDHGAIPNLAIGHSAAVSGSIPVLELAESWAGNLFAASKGRMFYAAANCGHAHVMRWLRSRYDIPQEHLDGALCTAAANGELEAMCVAREYGATYLKSAYIKARDHKQKEAMALILSWRPKK
ncbi:MAG: hypothetical protein KGL39_30115 [Patescibacteria group bacterium]|nr:hypothetical protein [Patescibacteria group bacterium]